MINFYDTSSLLLLEKLPQEKFLLCETTLKELSYIKDSIRKDETTRAKARLISKQLFECNNYEAISPDYKWLEKNKLQTNADMEILSAAASLNYEVIFITNDICLFNIAKRFLPKVETLKSEKDNYTGYQELTLGDAELATFYSDISHFEKGLLLNEYLILTDYPEEVYKNTSKGLRKIKYPTFKSEYFGLVKPKDSYQIAAMDSLQENEITLLGGPPGSGKTFLALSFLFSLMEKGKIDRIVIFCNPVVARNAAKLGYYPGSQLEKLLASQVGNVLSSKLGGAQAVERLINDDKIVLVPAGDARGYEVPAYSGVYILESQNLDIVLLKMLLQRIGNNCITIVDGDRKTQTDLEIYEGKNNGMERMSQVFRGQSIYGQIDLKNIYRSKISQIAENM